MAMPDERTAVGSVFAGVPADRSSGPPPKYQRDLSRWTATSIFWQMTRAVVLDIGGGSLELAVGRDEDPEVTLSLPLGAGDSRGSG
jgi:Ppx/GppA phosphatase family